MKVISEHLTECILEKMCSCMVSHDSHSAVLLDLSSYIVALADDSLLDGCDVEEVTL